jgi:uncharacterized protein YfaQ (DUF2300 family)
MNSIRLRPARILLVTWIALAGTGFALAADANSAAQARYQQEMAVCNSGQSNQDANTCRIEARNALAEARRGGLQDAPDRYAQNARQRCADLKDSERRDCEARVRGEGLVEGSVAGGGVLKETVTTHPVQ